MGLTANIISNKILANNVDKKAKVSANIISNDIAVSFKGIQGIQGTQGTQGIQGIQGPAGADGEGVPTGGTTRQALTKIDGTDNNTEWSYDFSVLALNAKFQEVTTVIAAGTVREYIFAGLGTIYGFVSTDKTGKYPTEHSFYSDFDGTNLTNLITIRE